MRHNCKGIPNVFIYINGLKEISSFGQDVFQKNLCVLKGQPIRLLFMSKHAAKIAPEKNKVCGRNIMTYGKRAGNDWIGKHHDEMTYCHN